MKLESICSHCLIPITYKTGQSTGKFCSNRCQKDKEYTLNIQAWQEGKKSGIVGQYGIANYLRRYLFEKYDNKCSMCGWGEINMFTGKIPLEVEHVDGNYLNNNEENLTLICPNCHSLTSTYKGANAGNGRKARSKYYEKPI